MLKKRDCSIMSVMTKFLRLLDNVGNDKIFEIARLRSQ